VIEFCSLNYEEELRSIVAPIPSSRHRLVILQESLAVTIARNNRRSGERGHKRAVPIDFIYAYAESREKNEGAVSKDAILVEGLKEIDTFAWELANWLTSGIGNKSIEDEVHEGG
jgi:hypothetical protein